MPECQFKTTTQHKTIRRVKLIYRLILTGLFYEIRRLLVLLFCELPHAKAVRLPASYPGATSTNPQALPRVPRVILNQIVSANFLMLIAALMSLSWNVLQSGHSHSLTSSVMSWLWYPQTLQVLVDGSHIPILKKVLPSLFALYYSFETKLPHAESLIA